ncbi:glutathione S-transferase kappa 1 [Morphnus guianensis]
MPARSAQSAAGSPPREPPLLPPPHGEGLGLPPPLLFLPSRPSAGRRRQRAPHSWQRGRGGPGGREGANEEEGDGGPGREGRALRLHRPSPAPGEVPLPPGRAGERERVGTAMARTLVELFYDVVSPYSWLGFEVLCRYRHIWNIDLRFRPAFLGGIMQATGNKPPAMLPKRAEYMVKDVKRMAKYYQVPVQISKDDFQRITGTSSLGAMRFITAIDMTQPQYLEPLSREFWIRFWSQHEDIGQPENMLAVAGQAGLSSELSQKLLEMISSPAVKNRLKETTEEAIKYGAFGMPAVVAHFNGEPHLFFGSDRLELLGSVIGEKWLGPVPSPKM